MSHFHLVITERVPSLERLGTRRVTVRSRPDAERERTLELGAGFGRGVEIVPCSLPCLGPEPAVRGATPWAADLSVNGGGPV